jgi:two-component system, NtrC family, response regulator HydG
MFTDFQTLAESIPCGLIIADKELNVEYVNEFAVRKVFALESSDQMTNLNDFIFYSTDMRRFDMDRCMRSMVDSGKRVFHKTLLIKAGQTEKLVYFSVSALHRSTGVELYVFNITDISDEMDCITHSPGTFGKGEFLIRKKIIGNDPKLLDIFRLITLAADSDVNVLIQGDSGTGKELVADAIHELSSRKQKPIIKVNCAAYPETLLESELFGHVKGAFTGAYKDKPGKFELAHGGTIFLDEIGEINQNLQVKLLRVIQEKTIERLGDNKPIKVDMRIVAATNKNLRELIKNEIFREDLFYRLNVFNIFMPSLHQRHLDIPLLADFFIEKFNSSTGKNVKSLSRDALQALLEYPWPGNIRELQNAIEHAFVLVSGNVIDLGDLPAEIVNFKNSAIISSSGLSLHPSPPHASLSDFKKRKNGRLAISKEQLESTLQLHDYNQSKTAVYLGISRVALWKKMKKLGL